MILIGCVTCISSSGIPLSPSACSTVVATAQSELCGAQLRHAVLRVRGGADEELDELDSELEAAGEGERSPSRAYLHSEGVTACAAAMCVPTMGRVGFRSDK